MYYWENAFRGNNYLSGSKRNIDNNSIMAPHISYTLLTLHEHAWQTCLTLDECSDHTGDVQAPGRSETRRTPITCQCQLSQPLSLSLPPSSPSTLRLQNAVLLDFLAFTTPRVILPSILSISVSLPATLARLLNLLRRLVYFMFLLSSLLPRSTLEFPAQFWSLTLLLRLPCLFSV
jgi:hypothetical protein